MSRSVWTRTSIIAGAAAALVMATPTVPAFAHDDHHNGSSHSRHDDRCSCDWGDSWKNKDHENGDHKRCDDEKSKDRDHRRHDEWRKDCDKKHGDEWRHEDHNKRDCKDEHGDSRHEHGDEHWKDNGGDHWKDNGGDHWKDNGERPQQWSDSKTTTTGATATTNNSDWHSGNN